MKPLPIDLAELSALMEAAPDSKSEVYLDLETGHPVSLSRKVMRAIDEDDYKVINHLPPKLRGEVKVASDVLFNCPDRYVPVPQIATSETLRCMRTFAGEAADEATKTCLLEALSGRGAFRRFRTVLLGEPTERLRWQAYHRAVVLERVSDWLAEVGVEPVVSPPLGFA